MGPRGGFLEFPDSTFHKIKNGPLCSFFVVSAFILFFLQVCCVSLNLDENYPEHIEQGDLASSHGPMVLNLC